MVGWLMSASCSVVTYAAAVPVVAVPRLDIPLQTSDVRLMGLVQSEALGEAFAQARVCGPRGLHHRCVGLEQNVDGRDRVHFGCNGRFMMALLSKVHSRLVSVAVHLDDPD